MVWILGILTLCCKHIISSYTAKSSTKNDDKLNCAIADAESVYEMLADLDFEVELFKNLDNDVLAKKLSSFSDKLEDDYYDAILLYYAGHGFQINGDNLLVPIDFDQPVDLKLAKRAAFPLDDLMQWLNKYPEKTKIIILDACRNNYSLRGMSEYFIPVTAPQGSILLLFQLRLVKQQ